MRQRAIDSIAQFTKTVPRSSLHDPLQIICELGVPMKDTEGSGFVVGGRRGCPGCDYQALSSWPSGANRHRYRLMPTTPIRRRQDYRTKVIGGPDSFVRVAQNFNTFGQAILNNLVAEAASADWRQDSAVADIALTYGCRIRWLCWSNGECGNPDVPVPETAFSKNNWS